MRDLNALANIGKHRGMLTNDISRPHRGKTDRTGYALTGVTFTRIDGTLF
ncbi:Uncharacterised protein [Citrobacter freundii]|nr:Uncharacterised protein [Citrobacter freundii]